MYLHANNKGEHQPAPPHGLTSTFNVWSLESIIDKLETRKISAFWLVSVTMHVGWSFEWAETPRQVFSR